MFTGGRPARLRRQALEMAFKFLREKDPVKFATAQVQIHERGETLSDEMGDQQPPLGSAERMVMTLSILDIQAEAFLSLVDDTPSQQQFAVLLNDFADKAFMSQTGYPLDQIAFMASPDEVRAIQKRAGHWTNESYKRLIPTPQPEAESIQVAANGGDETERRERLLAEYKTATRTATGEPSNRSIYEADNSPIHKPEFYKWLNGDLPADSATTINFERFLRSKKPPTSKHPKD